MGGSWGEGDALPPEMQVGGGSGGVWGGGEAPPTAPIQKGADSEGPDSEVPDSEGPDSEGPDSEYPKIPPKINQNPGVPDLRTVTP